MRDHERDVFERLPRALQHLADRFGEPRGRVLEDLPPVHLREGAALVEHLVREPSHHLGGRRLGPEVAVVRALAVEHPGEHAGAVAVAVVRRLDHDGAGAVAEQHRHVPSRRGEVEPGGLHLGADDEHAAVGADL